MLEIRFARNEDVPQLFGLLEEICDFHCKGRPDVFKSGAKYSAAEIREILADENRRTIVAVDDGEIVSSVFCIIRRKGGSVIREFTTLYVDDFCVKSTRRRQGIGERMFEEIKRIAREADAYNVELNVWEFPGSAVEFYEKMGMKTERRYMEIIL